mgnify:CR=1 FL=1
MVMKPLLFCLTEIKAGERLYLVSQNTFQETRKMTRKLIGFALTLALFGCASAPSVTPTRAKDYYDFVGQTTDTWLVEIDNPPGQNADPEVLYWPKGAPYEKPMQHVPGQPYLFEGAAPRGVPISFTVEVTQGTLKCDKGVMRNRVKYCGEISLSSNKPTHFNPQGNFHIELYRVMGGIPSPERDQIELGCKKGGEDVRSTFSTTHGALNDCRYLSYGYEQF